MASYDIHRLTERSVADAASEFATNGFIEITGVNALEATFLATVAGVAAFDEQAIAAALNPTGGPVVFPLGLRQRLAKIETSSEFARQLIDVLAPLLRRLIGPIAHVSSTFHAQFKGGAAPAVDHGGYAPGHLELHGSYLLHQDFTGANRPTSPSAVTLWLPLNTCPDWNLRIYPGSHRRGLVCNQWLALDDERLLALGAPVDLAAQSGRAILFNALALHGTSNPGPQRRVSCDIRFFPLCGFLPSTPHLLNATPWEMIDEALQTTTDETLRAPLLEDKVFAGQDVAIDTVPRGSVLNWVNYIACLARRRSDEALVHLERFTNTEVGVDPSAVYVSKFHGHELRQFTVATDGTPS
jgi:hypothetical protein